MRQLTGQRQFNWLLLLTVSAVGGLGLVNLSSAAHGAESNLAMVQAIWFGLGLLIACVVAFVDYRWFERLAYPLFIVSLMSLLAVLAFGKVANNSKRWLALGAFNVQPSEFMKIGLILALAKYFSDDAELVREQSLVSRILIRLQPLYSLCGLGALVWKWSALEDLGYARWLIGLGLLAWGLLAVFYLVTRGRGGSGQAAPVASGQRSYTLDDLIKPATPLYPLGAVLALFLFWERDAVAVLGGWRFVILAGCLVWAAASATFAVRVGRTSLHDMLSPVMLVVLPAVLIIRQPDLGTALVMCITAASMILFMKVRWTSFLIASMVLVVASVASWYLVLKPYQQNRIKAFIAPSADTQDTGYHARQSIIAVGSGRMTGKGHGNSTQTQFQFLPEQHTDFVFSVWAEEQGFVGCLIALLLFLFLIVQLVNVASSARDRFGVLLCVGMASLFFWHSFINIGMVIGTVPVVGLTLPLWSYGGSSVLAFLAGFGLVLSVSLHKARV